MENHGEVMGIGGPPKPWYSPVFPRNVRRVAPSRVIGFTHGGFVAHVGPARIAPIETQLLDKGRFSGLSSSAWKEDGWGGWMHKGNFMIQLLYVALDRDKHGIVITCANILF